MHTGTVNRILLASAVVIGVGVAHLDSQPSWDDTGIIAFGMMLSAGVLAGISSERPWLLGVAVGIWIPAQAILSHQTIGSLAMLGVLLFPLAGAYGGKAVRRLVTSN
jgi:hypothetical protein